MYNIYIYILIIYFGPNLIKIAYFTAKNKEARIKGNLWHRSRGVTSPVVKGRDPSPFQVSQSCSGSSPIQAAGMAHGYPTLVLINISATIFPAIYIYTI